MKAISVTLPIHVVSVANVREHHMRKAARTADHRGTVKLALWAKLLELRNLLGHGYADGDHVRVVLVRQGKKKLDGDNLQAALKACRDGVADALGVEDNDPRITWEYDQAPAGPHAVHVAVSQVETGVGRSTSIAGRPGQDLPRARAVSSEKIRDASQLAWAWWVPPHASQRGRPPIEDIKRKHFVLAVRFTEGEWDRLPHGEYGTLSRWVRATLLGALPPEKEERRA
jgi:hypothetical protein